MLQYLRRLLVDPGACPSDNFEKNKDQIAQAFRVTFAVKCSYEINSCRVIVYIRVH